MVNQINMFIHLEREKKNPVGVVTEGRTSQPGEKEGLFPSGT